ncbi:MAG: Tar ligand binding domain-containing protein [Magnetococcales bacterium]|nr:Tar ligand binding domain-containing protein [Magnetococcales bacterium]
MFQGMRVQNRLTIIGIIATLGLLIIGALSCVQESNGRTSRSDQQQWMTIHHVLTDVQSRQQTAQIWFDRAFRLGMVMGKNPSLRQNYQQARGRFVDSSNQGLQQVQNIPHQQIQAMGLNIRSEQLRQQWNDWHHGAQSILTYLDQGDVREAHRLGDQVERDGDSVHDEITSRIQRFMDLGSHVKQKSQDGSANIWLMAVGLVIIVGLIWIVIIGVNRGLINQLGGDLLDLETLIEQLLDAPSQVQIRDGRGLIGRIGLLADRVKNSLDSDRQQSDSTRQRISGMMQSLSDLMDQVIAITDTAEQTKLDSDLLNRSIKEIGSVMDLKANALTVLTESATNTLHEFRSISNAAESVHTALIPAATTSEQTDSHMQQALETVEGTSSQVDSVSRSLGDITNSVKEVRVQCQNASSESELADQLARKNAAIMERLSLSGQEIGKVVAVINTIAEQTNMLALNASIEAAGAGEAGKGFAVVANEVKDLARQTADATQMISTKVDEIRSISDEVSEAAGQVTETIARINASNQEILYAIDAQSENIKTISDAMIEVSAGSQVLTDQVRQSSAGVSEVHGTIRQIAIQISDVSQSVDLSGSNMDTIASRLDSVHSETDDMRLSMGKLIESMSKVTDSVQYLRDGARAARKSGQYLLSQLQINSQ